ncbi:type II toxin-antitoxin system antitoxin SocA domain-containing protein [Flavobacterium sp.]|uniref:Panacea domain-containing protein n=1 Tax=Flavobacterium sp. TaxID=239 RepID=UPI002624CCDD|nr:type II toxin-antitoxin system antitoxin SocA domain-containing protein [Flavobacterium sp.]
MKTSKQIADWIISKVNTNAGDTISPLKLQKLLYYCQAWHLAIFKTPLFKEEIQAWAHGPVVPSQYSRFSYILRNDRIDPSGINLEKIVFDNVETEKLLNEVFEIYNEHSATYLEALTHSEKPWIDARANLNEWERSNAIITHQTMERFYSDLNNAKTA